MRMRESKLYELQPDPYDYSQRRSVRLCLFENVKNLKELCENIKAVDAAFINASLCPETYIILAAASRVVHQAAHNRLTTHSLHCELLYSLSPNRTINEAIAEFGINENTKDFVVCIFDDVNCSRMKEIAKKIDGKTGCLMDLPKYANYSRIKHIYKVNEDDFKWETLSDFIVTRIATKGIVH